MFSPRFITAAEVLAERNEGPGYAEWRSLGGGHDGLGFFGFMPSCDCPNCRNYYDPTGEQIAAYLNCEPSFFDRGAYMPSFYNSDLFDVSYRAARTDGIYWNSGPLRDQITIDVLKHMLDTEGPIPNALPPRSILVIRKLPTTYEYHEWVYHPVDNGYKYTLHRNGENVYNAEWRARVIKPDELYQDVHNIATSHPEASSAAAGSSSSSSSG